MLKAPTILFFLLILPAASAGAQTLANDKVALTFDTTQDLRLLSAERGAGRVTFGEEPLWGLYLLDSQGGYLFVEAAAFPHAFQCSKNVHPGYEELVATWSDLVLDAANRIPSVTVTATLEETAFLAEFSIDVTCDLTDYTLFVVSFPRFRLDPIGAESFDDCLTYPKHGGYIVDDPVHKMNPTGYPHPGYWSMQFFTYYDPSVLLYLGTDDSEGHYKIIGVAGDGECLYWGMENIPENHTLPVTEYQMPYGFRLGLMSGDWRDAARYYKKWAVEKITARKTLADPDTDFPPTLRDMDALAVYHLSDGSPEPLVNYGITPEAIQGIRDSKTFFDVDRVAALFYLWQQEPGVGDAPWPEVTPLGNMAPGVAQLHGDGDLCAVYTYCSMTYDPTLPSFYGNHFDDYAVKDVNGQVLDFNGMALMDPFTAPWRTFTRDWCLAYTQAMDLDGMYFDVWSGVNFLDYDPNHGHAVGGGSYGIEGKKLQGQAIQEAVRQVAGKEGWFAASEFPQEFLVDELELVMWNFDTWKGSLGYAPPIRIPLFETVYGDRQMLFDVRLTFHEQHAFIWQNDLISYIQAARLSMGYTLGFVGDCLHPYGPGDYPSAADSFLFLKKLLKLQGYARAYLRWGEVQRPVRVTAVDAMDYATLRKLPDPQNIDMDIVPQFWIDTPSYPDISCVIPSVWKARDGSLAVVLVNWSSESRTIDYAFCFEDYGLAPNLYHALYRLDETGTTFLQELKGDFFRSDTVEARGVKAFVVRGVVPVEGPVRPGRTPGREGVEFKKK